MGWIRGGFLQKKVMSGDVRQHSLQTLEEGCSWHRGSQCKVGTKLVHLVTHRKVTVAGGVEPGLEGAETEVGSWGQIAWDLVGQRGKGR